ncbi:MAG: hypothetical protein ACYDH9_00495 [Limisphaerales bacterium]
MRKSPTCPGIARNDFASTRGNSTRQTDYLFELTRGSGEFFLIDVKRPEGNGLQLDGAGQMPEIEHNHPGGFRGLIA